MINPLLFAAVLVAAEPAAASSVATIVPAGTKIPLRVASMISSHDAHTGQTFTFYVDKDVVVGGAVVIPRCAAGSGTITLAGRHGINGHEGNLRLRFDTVNALDGSTVTLTSDEQAFNGSQRKAMAFFLSRWINGDDVEVKPDQVLTATVGKEATLGSARVPAPACPVPSPSPVTAP